MLIEYHLASRKISNDYLAKQFPNFDKDKFANKIGISERFWSSEEESSATLGINACKRLIGKYNLEEVDFLIVCTQTPQHILPGNASIIQDDLKLNNIPAIDINLGCSGYIYSLYIAKSLLSMGAHKSVLIVNTDTYSKFINKGDKANRGIFGDAASATILTKEDLYNNLFGQFSLGTDGSGYKNLLIQNGGSGKSYDSCAVEKTYGDSNIFTDNDIYMNGPAIFNFTIEKVPGLVQETLKLNSITMEDIDFFIFHQANEFMLKYLQRKISIPNDKFIIDMSNYGNTVSCTIPIALSNAIKSERIKKGQNIMLVGFGVGLSWGATILKI